MTLQDAQKRYPDAKEVRIDAQAVVAVEVAMEMGYGKGIKAKLLGSRSIPSSRKTTYQFIFSQKALKEEANHAYVK